MRLGQWWFADRSFLREGDFPRLGASVSVREREFEAQPLSDPHLQFLGRTSNTAKRYIVGVELQIGPAREVPFRESGLPHAFPSAGG